MKVLSVVLCAVSLAMFAWTGFEHARNEQEIDEVTARNCQAIEKLKAEFRSEALENYARLEENAMLLGIPLTSALREAAAEARDQKLRRFAPVDC